VVDAPDASTNFLFALSAQTKMLTGASERNTGKHHPRWFQIFSGAIMNNEIYKPCHLLFANTEITHTKPGK
jgi:hypothetical protein